jgi:Tol biopolymer transport system component/predicted Ser/Thr protein kinase
MSLSAGTRLGPYEILDAIGAGGMGEVYRANDTRLDRTVAIKILPAALSDDEAARQRLEREARAVSRLSHPHICALYDVGHEEGKEFLVMEYLEGETLADRIAKGPLLPDETLRYAIQIADALDKAHRQGIIHRDLKPGNVMLTRDGAKLLDFGLAKAAIPMASEKSMAASPTMTTPLTVEGTIVGTFQYISPEALEGKEADARSDIFAFGAVLYEMATGHRAFAGPTQASLIASILKEEPRAISTVQPLASPALDRLVQTCMAKDPDERRQSMHDVLLELKWIAEAGSQAGVPAPVAARRKSRARLAWTTAVALGMVVIALVIVLWQLASRPEHVVRAYIPPPNGTEYALAGAQPGPVAVSPDGSKLAFVAEDEFGDRILWVRNLEALTGQPLAGTERAIYPFWSWNSETIAFFSDGKLKKIDAAGGPVLSLCDASNGKGGTWNSDGSILFAPDHESPIHRVAAAGGEPTPVTEFDEERKDNSHRFPWFLPDGEHFLYFARAGSGQRTAEDSTIMIGSLGDEPDRVLKTSGSQAFFASGHLLFAREGALMAQPFDPGLLETTGDAFPIAEEVLDLAGAARSVFSVSESGILVYQSRGNQDAHRLVWIDGEGRETGELGEPADFEDVTLSPDGSLVAVSIFAADQGSADLWLIDVERGIRTRFTFDPGHDDDPVWSPDGTRVVFESRREGASDLYVNTVGGAETEQLLLGNDQNKTPTDWSRDGRHILYDSALDIWALPLEEGGEPFVVIESQFADVGGQLSPDGRWLAYGSDESGQMEVYVTSFPEPGRKWQVSKDGGYPVKWRGDGREIFHLGDATVRGTAVETRGSSLRVGAIRDLFSVRHADDGDLAADGQRGVLAIPLGGREIVPLTLVVNWTGDLE